MTISNSNSKMGNIPSFSLMPGETCGNVPCRKGCYAIRFCMRYKNVAASYKANTDLARHNIVAIENGVYGYLAEHPQCTAFRIHVAGDFVDDRYMMMWNRIARRNPQVHFFAFTKQFELLRAFLKKHKAVQKNLSIILSAWLPDVDGWLPPKDLRRRFPVAWVVNPKKSDEHLAAIQKAIGKDRFTKVRPCGGHCESCGMCFKCKRNDGDIILPLH